MRSKPISFKQPKRRQAFTLVEVMIAMGVGMVLAGSIMILLVQASLEQRKGLSDTTVEENAYKLQTRLINCLRGASSTQGMTISSTTSTTNSSGQILGYRTVYVFNALT